MGQAGAARWAAVVVNYEAGDHLTECVRSLLADDSAGPVELVVVDNGSTDGSVERMAREFPDVPVVRAPGNVGYARAANLGIGATRAPIVAVLNPDTRVEPGTAHALVTRLERRPLLGACGPRIKNDDGSDYPSARSEPSMPTAIVHALLGRVRPGNRFTRRYLQLDADPARAREVAWCSGAAMWLRRDALDDVGGWDERYHMFFEDVDLCLRLRQAGWGVEYQPAGVVWHGLGVSRARHPYRMEIEHHRSAWRFARRRYRGLRAVVLPFVAALLVLRAAAGLVRVALAARGRGSGDPPRRGPQGGRCAARGLTDPRDPSH
ncbi:MAG: hypothetical protein KatS3mg009_1382 [Acidimicrobiia bacterium]|nr:MAG: hypothetical protein KatS3mg009_1382 [Acidimicrobiia bacterium]